LLAAATARARHSTFMIKIDTTGND
jgi:hypothetical protein